MSRANRQAMADLQIIAGDYDFGRNSAGVPGGISAVPVDYPLHAGGNDWLPSHAEPWSSSIGYALAVEFATRPVSLVKAGAS